METDLKPESSGSPTLRDFHVFLSYNHADRESVMAIAEELEASGLRVWLDHWELRPGMSWVAGLNEALRRSEAVAIFVGTSGIGAWQNREVFHAL